jgi:hypothetical protein
MNDADWRAKKEECRNKFGQSAGDEPIYGDSGDGYECVIDAKCIDFSQGKLDFEDIKKRERECADRCHGQGGAWDFSYGECKCSFPHEGSDGGDYDGGARCDDCASQCPGASGTGCGESGCECYYDDSSSNDGGDDYDYDDYSVGDDGSDSGVDDGSSDGVVDDGSSDDGSSDDSSGDEGSSDSSDGDDGSSDDSSGDDGSSDDSAGITGEVVFWDYDLS